MSGDSSRPVVTGQEIARGLFALGVEPGSRVMVHSSLSAFGHVDGGARTVITALMELLSSEGTLLLPSFNHGAAFVEGAPGYYDPRETVTLSGAIPDLFWRVPGVVRSLDPTHPFAAWGADAQRYIEHHHRTLTMGPHSPLGLLGAEGGLVILLGVDYTANTFHHVVEMTLQVPCLGQRTEAYPVRLPDGRTVMGRTWGWRERGCPLTDATRYAPQMAAVHRQALIGAATVTVYRASEGFEVVQRVLQAGADGFPPCHYCPIRPRRVPQTVESDWDAGNSALKLDSQAWTY